MAETEYSLAIQELQVQTEFRDNRDITGTNGGRVSASIYSLIAQDAADKNRRESPVYQRVNQNGPRHLVCLAGGKSTLASFTGEVLLIERYDMQRKHLLVTSMLSAVVASSGPAAAEDNWDFTTTAYGWFAGLSGTVETPLGDIETDVDFGDILESLDIAFLGAFEARNNRVSLIADVQYFDLSSEIDVPTGAPFSGGETDTQTVLFSAYATYAVIDTDNMRFDLGGGLRYTYADIDVDLFGQGGASDVSVSVDGDYVDLLLAARLSGNFTDRLYGLAFADVGGFGIEDSSDLTWQTAGALGYRFNEKWSVLGGYRHLSIHREFGPTDTTTVVSGPFLGFQASF